MKNNLQALREYQSRVDLSRTRKIYLYQYLTDTNDNS